MSFLNPIAIAVAAGLTIPPLIALYFLKLKRAIRPVPSTFLWKKAIEDLHVNAPFQRLRSSLLLILQLLALIAAALALGQPMWATTQTHRSTIVLAIDQSASMGVVEDDGRTRLEVAKEQAKAFVDNMVDDARAMVIAFCDRATVVSPFDSDRAALKRKIDTIDQTQSTSNLGEAMSLAEAYTQNIVIGMEGEDDIELTADAPPATVALFTDGRIEDADTVALKKLDVSKMEVYRIGKRADNVAIIAMDARRHYEQPEILEVAATVRNFGSEPVSLDATLRVNGDPLDVQTVSVAARTNANDDEPELSGALRSAVSNATTGGVALVVFDPIEFGGGGVIEVVLNVTDALPFDNAAWTIIDEPARVRVLLVTENNMFLQNALTALPLEFQTMSPDEYDAADDEVLADGDRSRFDVVILDGHSTDRLPIGNYFVWGAAPLIEGVSLGEPVNNEIIFNWDDTHAILRHVAVEAIHVFKWVRLAMPSDAVTLIAGETSPVLSYVARDASQYLVCAFRLVDTGDFGAPIFNTYWPTTVDFLIFMQNAVQYLSSNIAMRGQRSLRPGEPISLPVPDNVAAVTIHRPDQRIERKLTAGAPTLHYAATRVVGAYEVTPGVRGQERFAVNLFNEVESNVAPAEGLTLGTETVAVRAGTVEVNEPAWRYLLVALLVLLLIEWIVYNQRVFV